MSRRPRNVTVANSPRAALRVIPSLSACSEKAVNLPPARAQEVRCADSDVPLAIAGTGRSKLPLVGSCALSPGQVLPRPIVALLGSSREDAPASRR